MNMFIRKEESELSDNETYSKYYISFILFSLYGIKIREEL